MQKDSEILIGYMGFILPINKNINLELDQKAPVLGGKMWLCYNDTRIIEMYTGVFGAFHAVASPLTLGIANKAFSYSTNVEEYKTKEFAKKLLEEINNSIPVIKQSLIEHSKEISITKDELLRNGTKLKRKNAINDPSLKTVFEENREKFGVNFK